MGEMIFRLFTGRGCNGLKCGTWDEREVSGGGAIRLS